MKRAQKFHVSRLHDLETIGDGSQGLYMHQSNDKQQQQQKNQTQIAKHKTLLFKKSLEKDKKNKTNLNGHCDQCNVAVWRLFIAVGSFWRIDQTKF